MKVLLGILLAAHTLTLGTVAVTPSPYHVPSTFTWQLPRRPHIGTLGVACTQGGPWVYLAEYPIGRSATGSASWPIENATSSSMPGKLDETQPASCMAWIYDERSGSIISNTVTFGVD